MNKINIPNQITDVLSTLNNAGYEAYLVGGSIRDYYLNIECNDYDVATSATIDELCVVFSDFKIIKSGLKHGTISLSLDNYVIEITTYRDLNHTLEGDLLLRDFTIDSLAYSPKAGIIDYYDGINDIKNKVIRINGNDDKRFIEDPLRILRAIRLSATLNFEIDDRTKNYIFNNAKLLNNVSAERIQQEFTKIMLSSNPSIYIREYFSVLTIFMPELESLKGFEQNNPHHIFDCLEHTLKVLDNVDANLILRLAALFHDSGKPFTYTVDEKNIGHFYGHYKVSFEIASNVLKRLKYSKDITERILNIIYYHDYPLTLSKKSIKKLINKVGMKDINNLFDLKRADTLGQNPKYWNRLNEIEEARKLVKEIISKNDCFSLKDLKINGNDLLALGISDGKQIGCILNQLLDLVINEEVENNKDKLLIEAKKIRE
jgi:tRNA nucleotidyltransferase (CCA-adding enzyme)